MNNGDAINAMLDYEESNKAHLKAGNSKKIKEISFKIRDATTKIAWDVEERIIPMEPMNVSGDTEEEIFKWICNQSSMIPDISHIRQSVEQDLIKNALLKDVTLVPIRDTVDEFTRLMHLIGQL